ncbi:cohesin domain-containing protein [Paenibacillus sp. FSL H7-0331]|uniref:cohesin domain-containing protein n=1 Tax=Paenibacillus sp. FSL H7-0331 TaxID=1920421 RepID=UPI00096D698E|nr:cohesin domain-containing protein [Paenibacillus sp. FSL H7-0331]OMF08404.1 hypothetical protein BK127_28785 [Paenibacillus sp. FSL H7-0331]
MKKCLSFLLFTVIFILMVPISSVFAASDYSGGLLSGKIGYYESSISGAPNDNNESTFQSFGSSLAYWKVDFPGTVQVDKIRIKTSGGAGGYIKLYDSSLAQIYGSTVGTQDGSLITLPKAVKGVKRITVEQNSGAFTLFEIQLYGTTDYPEIPIGVTTTTGNSQVNLNWNSVMGATGYNIKRSITAGGPYSTIASSVAGLSYTDTTVTNGITYYYVVSAVNAAGESTNSTQVSATPQAPLPATPINLTGQAGNSQVSLSWSISAMATGYNIKRSTTNGGPYTTISSSTATATYSDISVVNGTTYYYVVSAINAAGESANSNQVAVTPQAPLPAAPTTPILTAQSGNAQNTLTWTASSGATSYDVKRSTTPTGPYTTITSSVYSNVYSTYTDTSVVNGTTYYYVVSASNAGGSSVNSNEVSLTPQALEPTLNIVITEEKVKVGQEFTANVELKNVANIYAEDFTVKYDNTKFDYLGFESVTGYQVYNQPTDQNGTLRFIIASQGVNYGITGEKTFVKLKLRAKAVGVGKVDALKCRIADIDHEFDLGDPLCGEDTVTVENQDVNRSGEYTLLDLAIDGYYYGQLASNANPAIYTADQAGDEYVNNDDLIFIVKQMLLNTNYAPNL